MEAKAVSALRSERGLRPVWREAEPQVVGLAPQTTRNDRRANTMKTYLLRDPKAVEPQKRPRPLRSPPVPPACVGHRQNGQTAPGEVMKDAEAF